MNLLEPHSDSYDVFLEVTILSTTGGVLLTIAVIALIRWLTM
jgi:hypothetical protein